MIEARLLVAFQSGKGIVAGRAGTIHLLAVTEGLAGRRLAKRACHIGTRSLLRR